MGPLGLPFDGSESLFRAQQSLVNVAVYAVWLPDFTPTILEHLQFLHHLSRTFCELDFCFALTGTYPAYIEGVFTSYCRTKPVIGGLHIARTTSTIVDNIYSKVYTFVIGPFQFRLTKWEE